MANTLITRTNQGSGLTSRGHHYHPLDLFRREMDSLLDRFFGGWLTPLEEDFSYTRGWGFDVDENDKEIIVRADLPGFEERELDVRLEGDVLTIKAEKEQKDDGRQEYRSFYRQISLPPGVDADKVQASYRNGVLELHVPRPEGSQAKRITVKCQQTGPQSLDDRSSRGGGDGSHAGDQTASKVAKK